MLNHLDDSAKRRAIAFLAGQAKLPFDEVALMYERERAELELAAKVKKFLPIFTFRNVQAQLLLQRGA